MPIPCSCSACGAKFTAPDAAAGKKAKCKSCGGAIIVPQLQTGPPPEPKPPEPTTAIAVIPEAEPLPPMPISQPSLVVAQEPPAESRQQIQLRDCAFCGEEVLAHARKCKHCGETLDVALRAAEEARRDARESRRSRPVSVRQSTQVNVHVKAPFNHGLHLVLDLLTCGLWLPIHFLAWILR